MAKVDLTKLSIKELKALEKDVPSEIQRREDDLRKEALAAVKKAAKEHGFALSDLVGAAKAPRRKAAPKYRHPDNPSLTWSGRGRKPRWINEVLESGKSIDDLMIG